MALRAVSAAKSAHLNVNSAESFHCSVAQSTKDLLSDLNMVCF